MYLPKGVVWSVTCQQKSGDIVDVGSRALARLLDIDWFYSGL